MNFYLIERLKSLIKVINSRLVMGQPLKTKPEWVNGNRTGEYMFSPDTDTDITVHYKGGVYSTQVEWVEITQRNPVSNQTWDELFRFSRASNVSGTKPKLRKLRYDGKKETVETVYSTTHVVTTSIGMPVHTIEKYDEERASTGVLSGNVVGFWAEARKYSPFIEALMEQDNQLRLSPILSEFHKLDEPITEENPKSTFKDRKIVDENARRLYEESNRLQ